MNVDLYEKIWMRGVAALLVLFFAVTAYEAYSGSIQPPSHVETIDPTKAMGDARFQPLGVSVDASGHVHARLVGITFAWLPPAITVPAETPVTFHLTSTDVTHGFEIVRTNGQSMVVPGYISQFTTQFAAGEYLIACNEFCGIGHHTMAGKLIVVPASQWKPPGASPTASAGDGVRSSGNTMAMTSGAGNQP